MNCPVRRRNSADILRNPASRFFIVSITLKEAVETSPKNGP
jgi:hypothetical protein